MGSKLSFAVSTFSYNPGEIFYLQSNFLYSINLVFTIFIMVNTLFSEKYTETTRPRVKTFDTAKESLDPILSLK